MNKLSFPVLLKSKVSKSKMDNLKGGYDLNKVLKRWAREEGDESLARHYRGDGGDSGRD